MDENGEGNDTTHFEGQNEESIDFIMRGSY